MSDKVDTAALLSGVDIVAVIDAHVPLAKSGAEYEACCPFHTESTPSFKVNPVKGFFHCFGCGEHGDAIAFLQKHLGISFIEACRQLGADVGDGRPLVDPPPPIRAPAPAKEKKESRWKPQLPVPADAPEPPKAHVVRGIPQHTWCYRDAEGRALGYVYRFVTSDGGKEVLPLSWCVDADTGRGEWRWMSFPTPRPLYGLDRLAARPDATVMLVEGEKCADVGAAQLPDLVVVSWPGGGKAVKKTDWRQLAGRKVIRFADADAKRVPVSKPEKDALVASAAAKECAEALLAGRQLRGYKAGDDPDWLVVAVAIAQLAKPLLPEADQPGVKTMAQIGEILGTLGCKQWSVRIPAPGEVADGWDIADAVADGLTGEALAAWIRERLQADPPPPAPDDDLSAEDDDFPPESIYTAEGAGAGDGENPNSWRRLLLSKDGRLVDCRENVYLILKHHPAWDGVLWVDEFARKIVRRKPAPWDCAADFVPGTVWDPDDDLRLGLWLAHTQKLLIKSADSLSTSVGWAARDSVYHPVRDYLDSVIWDGVPRSRYWLTDYLGVAQSEYSALSGMLFLVGMVARIYQPGCQMRAMPILEGVQYRGKSSALRVLGGEWFCDTPLDLNNKDSYQIIQGVWLYEIAELDAFNRSEATRIKAWVSSPKDRFRAPYDRAPRDWLRQTVFAGSTNQDEYFKDPTGNTRFWPWRVEATGDPINLEGLSDIRDQLFAEAVALYKAGQRWHPTGEEQARLFAPEQEEREIGDAWQPIITRWLRQRTSDRVSVTDVLFDCLSIEASKIDSMKSMSTRVGNVMKRVGWEKKREGGGDREWYYHRPASWKVASAVEPEEEQRPAAPAKSSKGGVHVPF